MTIRLPWALLIIGVLITVVGGAVTGEWGISAAVGFGLPAAGLLAAVVALSAAFLPTAIHELGHAVAAKWVGFTVYGIDVGPLQARRIRDRWRLRWHLATEALTERGFTYVAATSPERLRSRYGKILIAGPLASLVLTIACGLAVVYMQALNEFANLASKGFILVGAVAAWQFIGSLLLNGGSSDIKTDGQQLAELRRNPQSAEYGIRFYSIFTPWSVGGVRARDWPIHMLDSPEPIPDWGVTSNHLFRYYHQLDRGEFQDALESIERAAQSTGNEPLRNVVSLELAYARARVGRDLEGAERAFETFNLESENGASGFRARAAIARLKGDDAETAAHIESGRRLLDQEADTPATQAERELLEATLNIEPLRSPAVQGGIPKGL